MVTRPCWKEKITYACESDSRAGCQRLKEKGCLLKKSVCVHPNQRPCLRWKRTYTCCTEETLTSPGLHSNALFCLSGDCHTPIVDKNRDMQQAVSYLAVLREIQNTIENATSPSVFKGEACRCARHMLNFTNCCSSMKGWGLSVGLSNCSGEEQALAKKKANRLCHYVGTYCAEKGPFGFCLRKKSTYCCFPSKLSRLFSEQGRHQIGCGWGIAEDPDCGSFQVDDLQKMNFEKMDLSELFQELFQNSGEKALKTVPHQRYNQMPTLQKNIDALRENHQIEGGENSSKPMF